MTTSPFNQLPTDAAWVRKVDELCAAAAKELDGTVIMIALQYDKKLGVTIEGIPDTGPLAEACKDVPRMLMNLAMTLKFEEMRAKVEPKH